MGTKASLGKLTLSCLPKAAAVLCQRQGACPCFCVWHPTCEFPGSVWQLFPPQVLTLTQWYGEPSGLTASPDPEMLWELRLCNHFFYTFLYPSNIIRNCFLWANRIKKHVQVTFHGNFLNVLCKLVDRAKEWGKTPRFVIQLLLISPVSAAEGVIYYLWVV